MRIHGTLIKWNDDRGFGFIALPQGHEEIFVHISAFPKDGVRPRIGETISFEVQSGADGRKRAASVLRAGARAPVRHSQPSPKNRAHNPLRSALTLISVGALALVAYNAYTSRLRGDAEAVFATPGSVESESQQFACDGRTHCSQMTSCEEAIYFLQHCPGTQMDGNNDGEPCEQQWCN
jgi:cold shock CspA family protein